MGCACGKVWLIECSSGIYEPLYSCIINALTASSNYKFSISIYIYKVREWPTGNPCMNLENSGLKYVSGGEFKFQFLTCN